MLRRVKVRTRLVAVIAVPLVVLLAVIVPEAIARHGRAADAERAADLLVDVGELSDIQHELQTERTLTAAVRAGAEPAVADALTEQRARTDAALSEGEVVLEHLRTDDASTADRVAAVSGSLEGLESARRQSDEVAADEPWADPYAPMVDALLGLQERTLGLTPDLGVGELTVAPILAHVREAAAEEAAQVAAASSWGELRGEQAELLQDLRAEERTYRQAYLSASPSAVRSARRVEAAEGDSTAAGRTVDALIRGDGAVADLQPWLEQSGAREEVLRQAEMSRLQEAQDVVAEIATDARRAGYGYLGIGGLAAVLAFGLAVLASRSITRPLSDLTAAADGLARDELPKLVDALRDPQAHGRSRTREHAQLAVEAPDEIGQVASALNSVQRVIHDVGQTQSGVIREGVSDLYVNLARRNQALLDRQIQALNDLEQREQDSDALCQLLLVDHLATRMRRNAESLLVLADAETGPRRSQPATIADVVGAALGEVEERGRVRVGDLADGVVYGHVACDVAHLLTELMENATNFSPPDTPVLVEGSATPGGYVVVVTDQGVGMPAEQIDDLNALLREPPATGLTLSRALGCLVAGRLGQRHGVSIVLRSAEGRGITATVSLPSGLLVDGAAPEPAATLLSAAEGLAPADANDVPGRLLDVLPTPDAMDEGINALLDRATTSPLVEPPVEPDRQPAAGNHPAEPAVALLRRVPGATAEAPPCHLAPARARRTPKDVWAMLSGFRAGQAAARVADTVAHEESS